MRRVQPHPAGPLVFEPHRPAAVAPAPGVAGTGGGRFARIAPVLLFLFPSLALASAPGEGNPSPSEGSSNARAEASADPGAVPAVFAQLVVTDSREKVEKRETPASVGTVSGEEIRRTQPAHPSEILGRVPGVWVSVTGGEGHMTAIRQPLTTSPVYLYLEDGVPTRSTGFFNHNALYEVNVPMAESVEVTKGPGSALYGSDAIAGVVNVLTRGAFGPPGINATLDAGSFGFRRVLASGNFGGSAQAVRIDANLTQTDGWREATGYERQSFTARWDRTVGGDGLLKTVLAYSHIDQQTAGASTLQAADYRDDPMLNLTPISYRKVQALRISSAYEREVADSLLSVVPYFRYDDMDILPNWSLTYDPTVYDTRNASFGVLARYRRSFAPLRTEVAAGLDLEYSPGSQTENQIAPLTTSLAGGRKAFTSYSLGPRVYDYDVTYFGVSPYASVELSPFRRLRVSAGLRLDRSGYEYHDNLTKPQTSRYRRPDDTTLHYSHLSPKLGVTYEVSPALSLFASFRNAFRAPSQGQVFRQGSAASTVDLAPVKADNVEAGLRAEPLRSVGVEVSAYRLEKRDDVLTYRDPADGSTQAVNAGRTRHAGIEAEVTAPLAAGLAVRGGWSWAKHTYVDWVVDPARGTIYSGNEMETAPRQIGRLELTYTPSFLPRASASLEWMHLGSYFMDAADTHRYPGHDLLNLRASIPVAGSFVAFARVANLLDTRYAENSSYTLQRGEEFAPGAPRSVFVGISVDFRP